MIPYKYIHKPERRGHKRKLAVIESFTDCDSEQATADPCLRAVLGTICNDAVEPDSANSLKQSTSNPSTQPRLKGLAVTGSIRFHVRKQPLLTWNVLIGMWDPRATP